MSMIDAGSAGVVHGHRRMSTAALVGLLLGFLFVPAIVDVVLLNRSSTGEFPDQSSVNLLVIGKVSALAIAVLAITALRWWLPVLREPLRVRRWVWFVPVTFLALSVSLADFTRLATAGWALSLTLLLGTLLIGASEELIYRGVVLRFMRDRRPELTAAAATAVIFGLSHVPAGPLNMFASATFGWSLYYIRRVSGGILLPIVVHAVYDFSVYSSVTTSNPNDAGNASPALFLYSIVVLVVLLLGRRAAEPRPTGQ